MRFNRRRGITNGIALIVVILVIAIPSLVYYEYFNQPLTKQPTTSSSASSSGGGNGTSTSSSGPAPGFVTGGVTCGFGLTYGSPGGEGCFIYLLNNGTLTATPTGTCNLTYGGATNPGTFSYADQMPPGASSGKVTCGSSVEDAPAGAGTKVSGQIFLTNGQYVEFNGTAVS